MDAYKVSILENGREVAVLTMDGDFKPERALGSIENPEKLLDAIETLLEYLKENYN